ncbi:hypothetical protein A2973_04645 [Candidatus Gottesmanbacteria bacterium RIFCSPLOWO2_01_FULL_49_10]|uniref:Uncharacterized protein n=1 Tax=Candidatus Gottesmanbacteria bacterium RIFCSPLOWO2_01_FULL_49_10 TaxID=1798396 RepID=A0A1F6B048_9BACT|nr:MAG: hypothetical protein A2973_04645 [Candidatus Gottesmanbacteria bacterium RIFCSPLOWO2_01_FULL_49_10]
MALRPDIDQAIQAEVQAWGLDPIEASAPGPAAGHDQTPVPVRVGNFLSGWFFSRQPVAEEIQGDPPLFPQPASE